MGWLLEKEDFPRDLLILARFEPYQILNQDESSLGNPFISSSQRNVKFLKLSFIFYFTLFLEFHLFTLFSVLTVIIQ